MTPPELGFQLFFAIAMSITAIPILGRIFMELGLSHTRTAALTIGDAAIDDVAGWLLLGVVSLIVGDEFTALGFAGKLGLLAGYLALVFLVVRPVRSARGSPASVAGPARPRRSRGSGAGRRRPGACGHGARRCSRPRRAPARGLAGWPARRTPLRGRRWLRGPVTPPMSG